MMLAGMSGVKAVWVLALCACCLPLCACSAQDEDVEDFFASGHTNNWAILVDTSRFWFNYRHVANVLSVYRSVKRLGIPGQGGHQDRIFIKNRDSCLKNVSYIR